MWQYMESTGDRGWPGAFFKGRPQCGFYSEVAERSYYADGSAFARTVAGGALVDRAKDPYVYAGEGERLWTCLLYTSDAADDTSEV